MTSRRRSRTGASLFAVYAVASLVPVAVLGALLVRGTFEDGLERALQHGTAQANVIEQMAIAPALRGADLSDGLTSVERGRLRQATDLAIYQHSVFRLRVLSFDGTVEFSDDGRVLGAVSAGDPAFQAAAVGGLDARIVEADATSSSAQAIRVLTQIVTESSGEAVGVLEVHLPYDQIARAVAQETRATIVRLALGLAGLYAVLALISWWTTRALRRHAAEHEHQALHDPLTGLPNRELFRRVAEEALARSRRGERGALVLVDLDHFKDVNDTLGHHAGDELLRVVARRLNEAVRTDDTVARLGGDEFGMVLPGGGDRREALDLLGRVRAGLGEEITLDGTTLTIEASFGVCFYPDDADTVEGLLQRADVAMYQGKHGPTGIVVYDAAVERPSTTDALVLQRELRQAVERDELFLLFQPTLDLASGTVRSLEALVRWQHPTRGLLPPGEFLPVAERSEVIEPMTRWVLDHALAALTAWTAEGHDWAVAVNISARSLSVPGFADEVADRLARTGVEPHRLHLEITETAMTFDQGLAGRIVSSLAALGVTVSVDDFGIGYTGLSQLRTLDVAEIKIDRAFIAGLPRSAHDGAIVRSVIDLAHRLGCTVTAEGVEEPETARWLREAGCDHGQGYLWMRPSPWPEVARVHGRPAGHAGDRPDDDHTPTSVGALP